MSWTIIGETRKKGKKYYKCRCDCGVVKDVYYRSVEKGFSTSCGCVRSELTRNRVKDLTGERFGKLVVLNRDLSRDGAYWNCKCDCGVVKSIKGTSLTKKKEPTRSCGCDWIAAVKVVGSNTIAKNSERQIARNVEYHTNFQVICKEEPHKNNTSGYKGVSWDRVREKWSVYIQVHGKRIFLGRYADKEIAIEVRKEAEKLYFEPLIESLRY